MKNILITCLICMAVLTQAQEKAFDVFQESSTVYGVGRQKEHNIVQVRLLNSKSGENVLLHKNGDKYITSLYAPAAELLHYFNIYPKGKKFVSVYTNSYRHQAAAASQSPQAVTGPHTTITLTAPLEYELKVFSKALDTKPAYIFQIQLEKAEYTYFETNVDNRTVQEVVKQTLTRELGDLPCCYRIVKYKARRAKGAFSAEYSITNETPVNITLQVPQALLVDSL